MSNPKRLTNLEHLEWIKFSKESPDPQIDVYWYGVEGKDEVTEGYYDPADKKAFGTHWMPRTVVPKPPELKDSEMLSILLRSVLKDSIHTKALKRVLGIVKEAEAIDAKA